MAKVLYHLATDANGEPKTAVFVDGNGRRWEVPPDTPTEFESDFMADKLAETCHYYGIVAIHTTKTKRGVDYDMEDAIIRAKESLTVSEKTCIQDYIKTQLEDRVRQNFPPLPPTGRALECCIKHQYNLLRAGIRCIGWEPPYQMEDPGFGQTPAANTDSVMALITQMQAQIFAQNERIMELMKPRPEHANKRSGKVSEQAPTSPTNEEQTQEPVTTSVSVSL